MLSFTMWMWLYISLNIVLKVDGYINGLIKEACGSMSPQHLKQGGGVFLPQSSKPPYMISFEHGNSPADPITVVLYSTSTTFAGFMLEVREWRNGNISGPTGEFSILEHEKTQLLKCDAFNASAVSHKNNRPKNYIKVQWSNSRGAETEFILRATVVKTLRVFWERVDEAFTLTLNTTEPPTLGDTKPSINTTSKPNIEQAGVALMCFDIIIKVVKIEIGHIVTVRSIRSPFDCQVRKVSDIICTLFCAVLEIASLILFCVVESYNVILVALVSVVIVINLIECVLRILPIGPTHELKPSHDIALAFCCVFNLSFTIAVVLVGVLDLDWYGENMTATWIPKVMGAFTAWIFLVDVFVLVFSFHVKHILMARKSRNSRHGQKKKLCSTEVIAVAVSVILIVGTTSFTLSIIVGTFTY